MNERLALVHLSVKIEGSKGPSQWWRMRAASSQAVPQVLPKVLTCKNASIACIKDILAIKFIT